MVSNDAPEGLEKIPVGRLVNSTGLDLNIGFEMSDNPAVRGHDINITQAYAAPDGFYQPIVLVNGQGLLGHL